MASPSAKSAVIIRLSPLPETEATLLASEFPELVALREGNSPPLSEESARDLAHGVLAVSRGHPGLLTTAGQRAGELLTLARDVKVAEDIWRECEDSAGWEAGYLAVTAAWSQ
jgi:hypothetical protein